MLQRLVRLLVPASLLALAACGTAEPPATEGDITAPELAAHVKTLSSDRFGGRAPGSEGETLTLAYLQEKFAALGLQPGFDGQWTQSVPLVSISAAPDMTLRIAGGEAQKPLAFAYRDDMMAWTKRVTDSAALDSSELVFVGYGIVAPEYDWNDYAGLDVEGKTVVMLVNDPGYATGNPELFTGKAMTYYGRWTYKFEEAARQGAAGALIVHETGPAGYPWEVVSGSWSGPQFDLRSANRNMDRVQVEGWLTHEAAQQLFRNAGLDYAALKQQAASRGFAPVSLQQTASIEVRNELRELESHNLMARLPGSKHPEESIIYTGHWDHLGTDPTRAGDRIFNGAQDNATGLAAILEIAEAFSKRDTRPERSILFLAVTAEESGLLGSRWYAENPAWPLSRTVAAINIDALSTFGPTRDVVVVGYGKSELEEYLARAAAAQDRVVEPEEHPEQGGFYRSDHFNFAKFGVPALYAEGGSEHVEKGADYGSRMQQAYLEQRYHKPADEYSEDWDLRGAARDARLFYRIGAALADSRDWPNWYQGTEFRAIREASRDARQ